MAWRGGAVATAGGLCGFALFTSSQAAVALSERSPSPVSREEVIEATGRRLTQELRTIRLEYLQAQVDEKRRESELLTHELEQRARWEGITYEEASRAKVLEVRALAKAEEDKRMGKLNLVTKQESKRMIDELRAKKAEHVNEVASKILADKRTKLEQQLHDELMLYLEAKNKELDRTESEEAERLKTAREMFLKEAADTMKDLENTIVAQERRLKEVGDGYSAKRSAHQLCLAALELRSDCSLEAANRVEESARAAHADLAEACARAAVESLSALPLHIVPTDVELRKRFETVARELRRLAMFPENRNFGVLQYILASVLDSLKLKAPDRPPAGDGAKAVVESAHSLVVRGDFIAAVRELDKLSGLPAEICNDWKKAARARVLVEQTVRITLNEVLSLL
eukprot:Plantae.Rhodophyta-Purpureofilum_apyrenoidigerum.ctg28376.p1 GENE.Plantae.Rhodophyta-Purpureofilum_apyrenoidigerum.ctg28376~~Plantae.Rhodophyta-Purpureofilum_apyrenoidigerum.ctg28376.p1  ORF type:complete len:400 (-),score=89.41 Plantae.Rhodophyta-Purpureofilum_apyrenoidigerum.ctg28376:216-1415(-)